MHSIAQCVCCLILLTGTALSQTATPSTPAQKLLTKGKQPYTEEGPKAALPQFEEAIKMFRSSNDRHGEAVALGYIANCHRRLENLDKDLEFAKQALRMEEAVGNRV